MTREQLEKQASKMKLLLTTGKRHVIRPVIRKSTVLNKPNYFGTKQASVGILKENETLQEFREKWIERKLRLSEMKDDEPE